MPDKRESIDWEAVRKRLQQNQIALEEGLGDDPRHLEETYRRRAARLARPQASQAGPAGVSVFLVFRVGSERYAMDLREVREVAETPQITPVPDSPKELAGVINVRGHIEPVWETSLLLGLGAPADRGSRYAVLLRRGGLPGALRVDELLDVRPLGSQQWQPSQEASSYAKGVTADMITLIEGEALLRHGGVG
jgi:chemotaxis signal transduction protein